VLVLVDADNVAPPRLQPVLDALGDDIVRPDSDEVVIVASGSRFALGRVDWPAGTRLLEHEGWQRADVALAAAYSPSEEPLVLVSGDGDFALLAARHPGPVLVISGAASQRLRDVAAVLDPATDGIAPVLGWLESVRSAQ